MPFARRDFLKVFPALSLFSIPFGKPEPPRTVLRFAVASDGHYGQPDTDFESTHNDIIRWLNQEKLQKGLEFVVFNGDLIHDEPTLLYDLKTTLKRLTFPFYVTRGNHDRVGNDVWRDTWGYPTNHSFARGDYAFLLGDTSNEKGEYLCPDASWLRGELAKYSNKKGIFVFLHITPAKWTANGVDCPEVRELLEKMPNVLGIFHGHDHDEDGQKISGGKPYLFDGHFGGSWGTVYKGYRIVEVYEDGTWQSYQYNPSASPVINAYSGKVKS
ncbi:metallophosphoesterase family protein [Telluribacter humicola]|uniref:metallophosphoesterase family protein n=1 Tax=Telluribacter humicola TaxID=1720261 RepID=UPI001A978D10|nr:metallophosphoesterase [Telluribacter humicola]